MDGILRLPGDGVFGGGSVQQHLVPLHCRCNGKAGHWPGCLYLYQQHFQRGLSCAYFVLRQAARLAGGTQAGYHWGGVRPGGLPAVRHGGGGHPALSGGRALWGTAGRVRQLHGGGAHQRLVPGAGGHAAGHHLRGYQRGGDGVQPSHRCHHQQMGVSCRLRGDRGGGGCGAGGAGGLRAGGALL